MPSYNQRSRRVSTGIIGLDEMCSGGFPEGNQVLITGEAGTGKTLLSFEILYRNAKLNIPSTFITLEEGRNAMLENVKSAFSYFDDIEDIINSNTIILQEQTELSAFKTRENWQSFLAGINKTVMVNKSKLLVIDSITTLRPMEDDDRTFTRYVNYMIDAFRNMGVTALITMEAETPTSRDATGLYGTFMFDGSIWLKEVDISGSSQYLVKILKMRRSAHRSESMPYEITPKGFNIFK
ncbi:MAG TPA: ATPase domain-containing protein [Candidatus Saccharimonadales bacterium]|nr:ATPase domain-containing protein [Candidatus Saccharimonadales bacterium]